MLPGVGLMHAPFALFPTSFPESKWKQACDLAPIFNELVDRVSLDANFLQESLSRSVLTSNSLHCCSVIIITSGSHPFFGTTEYVPFFLRLFHFQLLTFFCLFLISIQNEASGRIYL